MDENALRLAIFYLHDFDILLKDVQTFESILGSKHVVTDQEELDALNTDWTNRWKGNS